MIYLRRADVLDLRDLAALRAASLCELGYLAVDERPRFRESAARELLRLHRSGSLVAWLLCDDASVVGCACAVYYDRLPFPDGSLHAEVSGVYVAPPYRSCGYAAELVREIVGEVRGAGARRAFLRPSLAARALYERLGFQDDAHMVFTGPPCPNG
jgi:GNAT superfamily N-acetyltransferase